MRSVRVPNNRLYVVARNVESFVPDYDITQSDPIIAARTGKGNCVAKAVIAAVTLDKYGFEGAVEPALSWNNRIHPKKVVDMSGKQKKLNGHAWLLTTANTPSRITYLSFNAEYSALDNWVMEDFNGSGKYAEVSDGHLVTTDLGKSVGYEVHDWHNGGRLYQEALGVKDSSFHNVGQTAMSSQIFDGLHSRGLLDTFDIT